MRVDIKEGGDGVACWNAEAITAYAAVVDAREAALASANPDLDVTPGRVKCYGCEVQEYHYAMKCTAELTKTLFAVEDEVKPRAADAVGLHREIPGLATTRPDDEAETAARAAAADLQTQQPTPANNYLGAKTPAAHPSRPSGLRGLFSRGG